MSQSVEFVGLDVHKDKIAVAVAVAVDGMVEKVDPRKAVSS